MYKNKVIVLDLVNHFPKDANFEIQLSSYCEYENRYKIQRKAKVKDEEEEGGKKKKKKKQKTD